MRTSIKELRKSTREIISAIDRGDTVFITYRGKVRAKIVPVKQKEEEKTKDKLFGIWKDHSGFNSVEEYIDNVRKERYP
jgi:antitoxin (DNA-binding transcriptional repressor) of toxin-antitoxin stability system